jgi:hypothetical protein
VPWGLVGWPSTSVASCDLPVTSIMVPSSAALRSPAIREWCGCD